MRIREDNSMGKLIFFSSKVKRKKNVAKELLISLKE